MLYEKVRPRELRDVLGNAEVINTIYNFLENKNVPQAILLHGPAGCGKTTLAKIIARTLCNESAITEINAANFNGIQTARDIASEAYSMPLYGKNKAYILDESHQMTNQAQQAFLKVIEEPPNNTYFLWCTTDPQRLIKTIRDRCVKLTLRPLTESELSALLSKALQSSNIKTKLQTKHIEMIAEAADGCPREALVILEAVLNAKPTEIVEVIKNATLYSTGNMQVIELCRALSKGASWKTISSMLKGISDEPESVRRAVLGYFNTVLLNGNAFAALVIECFSEPYYNTGKAGLTLSCYNVIHPE